MGIKRTRFVRQHRNLEARCAKTAAQDHRAARVLEIHTRSGGTVRHAAASPSRCAVRAR